MRRYMNNRDATAEDKAPLSYLLNPVIIATGWLFILMCAMFLTYMEYDSVYWIIGVAGGVIGLWIIWRIIIDMRSWVAVKTTARKALYVDE